MKTNRILFETILVTVIAVGGMLFLPQAKLLFALVPPVYLLIERHIRKRSWAELGFKFSSFWQDLRTNWLWFVLVGVIAQPLTAILAKKFFPEYLAHVIARLPFPQDINWMTLVPLLAFSLIAEELTFRSLIQGRFTAFTGTKFAILLASILFGVSHFAQGTFTIVALDISAIIIDSIIYGIIYARGKNLIVVWMAHLLGDIIGLIFLLNL